MESRRKLYFLAIFLVIISLGLSACVRPVPGEEGEATPASETGDPNVGGGTDGSETQPESGGETQPAPEGGDQGNGETQPAPEGGDQDGNESQPASEDGEQGSSETQPAPEEGNQESAETQPVPPPSTGDQPTQGGSTIGTPPATEVVHYVQPGENLFRIGLQYGYSWVVLARYNGIPNPNYIYVGQPILIPAAGGGGGGGLPPTDGAYTNYVVQPGDNLFRIGLKYGMSWVLIAEANGLTNPHYIYPGQVLKIPVVATPYS